MKKLFFVAMIAVIVLASCKKDDGEAGVKITGGQMNQTVYADDNEGVGAVTFETTGAWTSTITEVPRPNTTRAEDIWISISPASGNVAGNYALNIYLSDNYTGVDRTATINIICNGTTISITVTQKAITEDGELHKEVKVTGIKLDRRELILTTGSSETLIATVVPENATNKDITWSVSTPSIVTVDNNGKVTAPVIPGNIAGGVVAGGMGTAIVTATSADGEVVATCNVSVAEIITMTSAKSGLMVFNFFSFNNYLEGNSGGSPSRVIIDWGDGENDTYSFAFSDRWFECTHNYSSSSQRTITIALVGIAYNYGEYRLDVSDCELTTLDINGCTTLEWLNCRNNLLSNLNVRGCNKLRLLVCMDNQLTSLNISECPGLTDLSCENNQLTSLDISRCIALELLECGNNPISNLNVSGHPTLTSLRCDNVINLDVSNCTKLTSLGFSYSDDFERHVINNLNASGCTALKGLMCYSLQMHSLNVSGCTALEELLCMNNQLTSLNVSGCRALNLLATYDNLLNSLDISENTALTNLDCRNNQLTNLDISNNTALAVLWCSNNHLTNLDTNKNTALTRLMCHGNQLIDLDISNNTALEWLSIYNNSMQAASLNNLFKSLHNNPNGLIWIFGNQGAYDCDTSIVTAKGWTLPNYHYQ